MNWIKLTFVILISSYCLVGQEDTIVVVFGESPVFTVDTQNPFVDWISPNGGETFDSGDIVTGMWSASDESFGDYPISIFVTTTIGGDFDPVAEDLPNDGSADFQLPSANTAFARSKIRAVDQFGNEGVDFSDVYFTIGEPTGGAGDTTLTLSSESPVITVDTENPFVDWLSPDGEEVFASGEVITGTWSATDINFGTTPITISLATSIGGMFDPVAEDIPNDGSADLTLPTLDTPYGRIKVVAKDDFGNISVDYSLGYFTIGEADTGGISDTMVILVEESDSIWVDTQDPFVDLFYPDGREAFLVGSEFPVQWTATDSSFDTDPIIIALATEIGGIFEPQTDGIVNSGEHLIIAPDTSTDFARARVIATDHFGNTRSDESQDYFTIFPSGTGAITGKIIATRVGEGFLYLDLWFPGSDPDVDLPDIRQDSIYVNFVEGDSFTYSFAGLLPGSGYSILAFLDKSGSPTTGLDQCDYLYDTWGEMSGIEVAVNQITSQVNIMLEECEKPPYSGPVWHVSTTGNDSLGNGSEIYPFASIMKAVNNVINGDTVLIHSGTYIENVSWNSKSLSLIGIFVDSVIIDGKGLESVISIENTGADTNYIENITITDGLGTGAGINIEYSNVVIRKCNITDNQGGYGGGIRLYYSHMRLISSKVENDTTVAHGAGIHIQNSTAIMDSIVVSGNTVIGSNSTNNGGGIYIIENSDVSISNSVISNNSTGTYPEGNVGGGISSSHNSNLSIRRTILYGNTGGLGSAMYFESGGIINIENSTITENKNTSDLIGVIDIFNVPNVNIVNSILWGNFGDLFRIDGVPEVSYSDLDYDVEGIGNITSDPLFLDPDNSDYHLQPSSPCIDTGDPDLDGDGITWESDPDDQDPDGTRMDMGAYYFNQSGILPALPQNLAATPGNQQITLRWNSNAEPNLHKYNIYRDITSPALTLIDSVFHPDTSYTNLGLVNGQTYYYRITVMDSAGNESGFSDEVHAIPVTVEFPEYEPDPGTIALWHFNEGTGVTIYDHSGNANHGMIHDATWTLDGKFGSALSFDGDSDYVTIPNVINGLNKLTVEAWFKYTNTETWRWIFGTVPGWVQVGVAVASDEDILRYHFNTIDGGFSDGDGTHHLNPDQWYHVALTYDGVTVMGYVNGVLDFERAMTGQVIVTDELAIGAGYTSSNEWFYGSIDEFRISNVVRDVSEFELQIPPAPPQNLIASPGDEQVTLNWDANSEIDLYNYHIYRDSTSPAVTFIDTVFHLDTVYVDTGLANGHMYYYRITAVDSVGNESDFSEEVSATPWGPVLLLSPDTMDFGTNLDTLSLFIENIGFGELSWQIVEDISWLTVFPDSSHKWTFREEAQYLILSKSHGKRYVSPFEINNDFLNIKPDKQPQKIKVWRKAERTSINKATSENYKFGISKRSEDKGTEKQDDILSYDMWSKELKQFKDMVKYRSVIDTVLVSVDRTDLEPGHYEGILWIYSNGGDATVQVTMEVQVMPYYGPVWYISTEGSNTTGNGSETYPFATIQHGIDMANNGDTVLVQPGTYVENINFNGKNLVLGSLFLVSGDTSYISQTVIDGNQNGSVVMFQNGEDSTAVLSGFTITNGYAYGEWPASSGGGIHCEDSSPSLENIAIIGNTADIGAGLFLIGSSPRLTNVIVNENSSFAHGGGMAFHDDSHPSLVNVTITENSADWGGGIAFFGVNNTSVLVNTILWDNLPEEIAFYNGPSSITVAYSDIKGGQDSIFTNTDGTVTWLDGNINADPLFVNPDNGDYHLQWGSPCIDAGDPNSDLDPDGTIADMGAFYYDQTYQPPNTPTNLSYIPATDHIILTWSPVFIYDISHYEVFRSENQTDYELQGIVNAPNTIYLDQTIDVTVPNYYVVVAVDTMGLVSENSDVLEVSYPILILSTQSLAFDTVLAGYSEVQQIILFNIGSDTLSIDSIYIAGEDVSYFNVDTSNSHLSRFGIGAPARPAGGKDGASQLNSEAIVIQLPQTIPNIIGNKGQTSRYIDSRHKHRFNDDEGWSTNKYRIQPFMTGKVEAQTHPSSRSQLFGNPVVNISAIINPGDSLQLVITFAPLDTGSFTDKLIIFSNEPIDSATIYIPLSGAAIGSFLSLSADSINFGSVFVDSTAFKPVIIRNRGQAPLEVTSIVSSDEIHFTVTPNILPSISPGDSAQIIISFAPNDLDTLTALITVNSNDLYTPIQTITLRGVGVPHNYLPSVVIFPLEGEQVDTVLIYYALSDVDNDILSLKFEYLSSDSSIWLDADILEAGELLVLNPDQFSGVAHWLSYVDFPNQEVFEVLLKSIVSDDYGSTETLFSIHVDNFHGMISMNPIEGEYGGDIEVHYTLSDPWGDVFSLLPQFLNPYTNEWTEASVEGILDGIGPDNYSGFFYWQTLEDLPMYENQVKFRIFPHDGLQYGQGDTLLIDVDNVGPPQLLDYGPKLTELSSWRTEQIFLQFSGKIDVNTLQDAVQVLGDYSGDHSFTFEYSEEDDTAILFPEKSFAGAETVRVIITPTLTDTSGIPFDGNGNGDIDLPSEDEFTGRFVTTLLGDYTLNGIVNYIDLAYFREAWVDTLLQVERDIGPADGDVPHLVPIENGDIDFEDLMVFAQMWNWSYENEDYHDSTVILAKMENSDNPVHLTLDQSKKNAWLPPKEQEISISIQFDSLASYSVFGIEYQYNPEIIQFSYYQTALEEPWVLLDYSDLEKGKIVIAGALLSAFSPKLTSNNVLTLSFNKLLDSYTEIDYLVSLWDHEGINKTYPTNKFLFSTEIPLPEKFVLHPNFPNPFNPATTIRYEIPADAQVNMSIYNILGQKVITLVDRTEEAGYHQVIWHGEDPQGRPVSSGIYILFFKTEGFTAHQKIILLK